jgi:glycosyltransferase involved in cell wall biosynthesis
LRTVWLILPVFKVGGVEKWIEHVFRVLEKHYEVTVYVTGEVDIKAQKIFSVDVKKINILSLIKEAIKTKPDYVISALTPANVLACIIFAPLKTKVITSIHLTLGRLSSKSLIHQMYRFFAHWLINIGSTRVIAVSDGVKKDFYNLVYNYSDKAVVIYNPCFQNADINLINNPRSTNSPLRFVAVGRFDKQKNFKDLMYCFLRALEKGCDYYLDIFGDGPEFEQVAEMIPDLYSDRIKLLGNQPNIISHLSNYDIFVLPSLYEGFGNVLAEALSAGLYCISRDCPHGPSEILNDGEFGILINPSDDLAIVFNEINLDYENYIARVNSSYRKVLHKHLQNFTSEEFSKRLLLLMAEIETI